MFRNAAQVGNGVGPTRLQVSDDTFRFVKPRGAKVKLPPKRTVGTFFWPIS